jgi:hypothetical protein
MSDIKKGDIDIKTVITYVIKIKNLFSILGNIHPIGRLLYHRELGEMDLVGGKPVGFHRNNRGICMSGHKIILYIKEWNIIIMLLIIGNSPSPMKKGCNHPRISHSEIFFFLSFFFV